MPLPDTLPSAGSRLPDTLPLAGGTKSAPEGLSPAQELLSGTADALDFVVDLVSAPIAFAGSTATRVQGIANQALGIGPKRSREEIAEDAQATSRRLQNVFGEPARKTLTALGLLPEGSQGPIGSAFSKAMGLVERDAAAVEERTGGKVLKEDVLYAVEGLFGALGAKGTQLAAKAHVDGKKAKTAVTELAKLKAERASENLMEAEGAAQAPSRPVDAATNAQARATVASLTPEAQKARKKELAELRREVRARFSDTQYDPLNQENVQERARTAAIIRDKEVDGAGQTQEFKMDKGYGPDPTMDWLRGGAAVGVGLGALYALAEDNPDVAAAMTAGAFVVKGGKAGLRDIAALPDAAPLASIKPNLKWTFSTLEALPENRFSYSKDSVRQLLNRQEVTKLEKDVLGRVLDGVEGDSITAKQLAVGMMKETGDFELTAKPTQEYAPYGLENIDRLTQPDEYDYGTFIPEHATQAEEARLLQEARSAAEARELAAPPAITRIYQSPIELGSANHFGDPYYFGHTRSFKEGGVRHVVEVQSDLVQKLGKELTPEARNALLDEQTRLYNRISDIAMESKALYDSGVELFDRLRNSPEGASHPEWQAHLKHKEAENKRLRAERNAAAVRLGEIQRDLQNAESAEKAQPVAPMAKNWYKRLIREEVADAAQAQNGAGVIRFADADTVAKVEGWPDGRAQTEARLADLERQRANLMQGGYGGSGLRPDVELSRVEQLIEHEKSILAGMRPGVNLTKAHQGIYDRYAGDITKFLKSLGAKHVKDSSGHGWWEVPLEPSRNLEKGGIYGGAGSRRIQMGAADPAVIRALGAAGFGAGLAYLFTDDPKDAGKNVALSAALFGLAGLAISKNKGMAEYATQALRGAEHVLGNLSADLRTIAPALVKTLRSHEMSVMKSTNDRLQNVKGFVDASRAPDKEGRRALGLATMTGRREDVIQAFARTGNPDILVEWQKTRQVLADIGRELKDLKLLKDLKEDYFPRIVVDVDGLLNALGREGSDVLERKITEATKRSVKETGKTLNPFEVSLIINKHLEEAVRTSPGRGKPGFLKKRSIEEVTPELYDFYAPPSEAVILYIRGATRAIERAKFFGRNAVRDEVTGRINIEASIGNVVGEEWAKGKLTREGRDKLTSILRTRFGPAEAAPDRITQAFRTSTQLALLGNLTSAIQNLSDVAVAGAAHGYLNAAKAAASVIRRDAGRISVGDLGLVNNVSEEFIHGYRTPVIVKGHQLSLSHALDKVMKWSGFSHLDTFSKEVHANAALNKYRGLAKSPKGQLDITRDYGEYFGKDLPQLIEDLRSGKQTTLTTELAFAELSDFQPVSKMEMPQLYHDHPNGRFMYTLRSWMIKQLNVVRERGLRDMASGDPKRAMRGTMFLLRYGITLGLAGATMSTIAKWINTGELESPDGSDIADNVMKTFGWSQYVLDKARQGDVISAVGGTILPPYKVFADILEQDPRAISYIPIIGKPAYGRTEEAERRRLEQKAREARAEKEDTLTDTEREAREARRERARQRRLEQLRRQYGE